MRWSRQVCLLVVTAAVFAGFVGLAGAADPLPGVLLSRQLMARGGVRVGDTVTLSPDPEGDRVAQFRVVGVYEPTPDPMKFNVARLEAWLHLPDLIALTSNAGDPQTAESITAINVRLTDPSGIDGFIEDVSRRTVGLAAAPTARSSDQNLFSVLERFHVAIAAVTVVGSTAFLLALMVIRAEERREIVGMLRLIGVSRRSIILEILIEGMVVAVAGAAIGILLAWAAQYGINQFFQARYDTPLVFVRVTPAIALRCLAVALPIGVMTGAAAAWLLVRRPPAGLVRR
jgi:putative ABC transport system permease protein